MSAVNVVVGQTVKLDILVTEGGAGLFPRAVLLDGNNTPISGSPLDLVSVSGDLYSGTFVMPDTAKVTAVTTVYTDSGHTTPDTNYDQSMDEFISLVGNVADLAARVTELVTISRGVLVNAANGITVEVARNDIVVEVSRDQTSIT